MIGNKSETSWIIPQAPVKPKDNQCRAISGLNLFGQGRKMIVWSPLVN